MPNIKFSQLNTAPDISELDFIVGIKLNEDETTYTNYKFTPQQLIDYSLSQTRKAITITDDGATEIVDDWIMDKDVQIVFSGGQAYMLDVDFTQTDNALSFVGGVTFSTSQKVILML